jgi:hypothetical protein
MARIDQSEETSMNRNAVHEPVQATYSVFRDDQGNSYLQIDTYGSQSREFPGKKSLSLQFSPVGIQQLSKILDGL